MSEQSNQERENTPEISLLKSLTKKLGGSFGCHVLSESEALCTSRIPVNVPSTKSNNADVCEDDLWKQNIFGTKKNVDI